MPGKYFTKEMKPPRLIVFDTFPFLLFQSGSQFLSWVTFLAMGSAAASFFVAGARLEAWCAGSAFGSLFLVIRAWTYELRVETPLHAECLHIIKTYLAMSNFIPLPNSDGLPAASAGNGMRAAEVVERWTPRPDWNHPKWLNWLLHWKENEVYVVLNRPSIVIRGPSTMIKPLWRNLDAWGN